MQTEQTRADIRDSVIRSQLLTRHDRLSSVIQRDPHAEHLLRLLQEVDAALERMEKGTYGLCETCHATIESSRLLVDPLIKNCLDHLSKAEQQALQRDLDLAYEVQTGLLPKPSIMVDGWRLAYHYESVGPVSGDFVDVIIPPDRPGTFYFVLGDVSGKGVAASLLMAHLHAIFRSLAHNDISAGELVVKANRIFCQGTPMTHFATLVCGKGNASGELEICNAGHCLPVLAAKGEVREIPSTGIPLGLFCDGEYQVERRTLTQGESLLLFTDGLSELRNEDDVLYGEERIAGLVRLHHLLGPDELVRKAIEDARSFRVKAPKTDDVTILAIRREPS